MSIKLKDYIEDPHNFLTEEEAELIYKLAGFPEEKDEESE